MQKHIVSFSGGKDSTAMLLMMIEKNMKIDDIIFCDTGMEHPFMYDHITQVERRIKRKITILKNKKSFRYYLGVHKKKNGQVGYGWPDFRNRWCSTLLKTWPTSTIFRGNIQYQGIAADEIKRATNKDPGHEKRYPLIKWKMTQSKCLDYCHSNGFTWNGLYTLFSRSSCWCCPMQRIKELRNLRILFPKLWEKLKRLDKLSYRKFRPDYSLQELENKFKREKNIGVIYANDNTEF